MLNRCVSCLGSLSLLHPLDVIINVSYGALWQKHVAWGTIQTKNQTEQDLLFTFHPNLPHSLLPCVLQPNQTEMN
jgi:hypothetical protein